MKKRYEIDNGEQLMCDILPYRVVAMPTAVVELYEAVDIEALTYAVKKTLYDHPYFATRLIRDGVMFYWEENDAEPVIEKKSANDAFVFGHKADNFFPWKVTYNENTIYFNVSHELTDGSGVLVFIATAMEYYARYLKGDMTNIPEKTTREARIADETALLSALPDYTADRFTGKIRDFKPNPFDEKYVSEDVSCKMIMINKSQLRNTSFSFDASPFAVIAPIMARACLPYLSGDDKIVKMMIPHSLRGELNSNSLHNLVEPNNFYYIDKIMRNMPFEQIATIFRARLDLLSDSSIVTETIDNIRKTGKAMTTAEGRQQVARSMMGGVFDVNIDYTHITHTGMTQAAEEYVKGIYFQMFKKNPFITCIGVNYKNDIQLLTTMKLSDDGFYDNICNEFDKLGVSCSCKKMELGGERFFEFDSNPVNS